jgi:hypothetical protein
MNRLVLAFALVLVGCGTSSGFEPTDAGVEPDVVFAGDVASGSTCEPSPLKFDVPGNGCDDDANGVVDDAPSCDDGLGATGDASDFARAIGLCQVATGKSWGVVVARYANGFRRIEPPDVEQHAILGAYGDVLVPREGKRFGAISTGVVDPKAPKIPGRKLFGASDCDGPPITRLPFVPPGVATTPKNIHDLVSVHLEIKVPVNARGFSANVDFLSAEWPEYILSYNDSFIVYLESKAMPNGVGDNVAFDEKSRLVSVASSLLAHCSVKGTGCSFPEPPCTLGPGELAGTWFGGTSDKRCIDSPTTTTEGGSTGWLEVRGPVLGGETISVDFMIWDGNDQILDSIAIVDAFRWSEKTPAIGAGRPPN